MARTRTRRSAFKFDETKIYERVKKFHNDDSSDRATDMALRLQRQAKVRQWTDGTDYPWEDASDVPWPDIATATLHLKDTLHNAVMSSRPVVTALATQKTNKDKQEAIDQLIDYQVFVEQEGEHAIGEIIEDFVDDGVFTCFTPWVRESREVVDAQKFPPIPEDTETIEYFFQNLKADFPEAEPIDEDGFDWRAPGTIIQFYTEDDGVLRIVRTDSEVFNGPKLMPKSYNQVYHGPTVANLQMPGPSNPGGAPHVILEDFPTIDEVRRLQKSGVYDLMTDEEAKALDGVAEPKQDTGSGGEGEVERQKDIIRGSEASTEKVISHRTVTRWLCFDVFDIDGDGIDEDVVWWVIDEAKTVVRARELTEQYPSDPPRRPLSEASMIPVRARRTGIGLPELMEGLHDVAKELVDQTMDAGTVKNSPFWFYRAHSTVKPEIMRLAPGEGYPLPNPQQDVNFPQFGNSDQTYGLNFLGLIEAQEQKLITTGDLNLGQVPPGQSTALRTTSNMQLVAGQSEARPERILRRFFIGLTDIWAQIHQSNQRFLPQKKTIRVIGLKKASEDPYRDITRDTVTGAFDFDFTANVLNSSRLALQKGLGEWGPIFINPLSIQMGTAQPDGVYRYQRDAGKALGIDPDKYLSEPSQNARANRIMAEDAISIILSGGIPVGEPAEGALAHLQILVEFSESDQFGFVDTEEEMAIFKQYLAEVQQKAEAEQQQLSQAAAQFGQQDQGQPGAPTTNPADLNQPPLQEGELRDERLPGA